MNAGGILLLANLIYPHWLSEFKGLSLGYAFQFSPPANSIVDWGRLISVSFAIIVMTVLSTYLARNRNRSETPETHR
jgi:hypothetical protein